MIWGVILASSLFLIFALVVLGCTDRSSIEVEQISLDVRVKVKKYLKPLDPVNYYSILGRIPSKKELHLGRMLFNDTILSRNNDVSCATCHLTNHGFADGNPLNTGSTGRGGPSGDTVGESFGEGILSTTRHFGDDGQGFRPQRKMFRNSLSTVNVAFRHNKNSGSGLLWDGRFGNLFFQVLLPIHTPEELCGQNPLPVNGANPFKKGGKLFRTPINLKHTNFTNSYSGKNRSGFNFQRVTIDGVPKFRKNGNISYPNRNECLAIALAKLNSVKEYKRLFKEVYKIDVINDKFLGVALTAFVLTHISKNTPYDQFVAGQNNLTKNELYGLSMFMTPLGEKINISNKILKGAGCVKCHSPPTFSNNDFYSLRVKSDPESILTLPKNLSNFTGGFFNRVRGQRGAAAKCHIEGVTVLSNIAYAPDIGRAAATTKDSDCFKFRVPTLRNIIETFPYYHHGTEQGQSYESKNIKEKATNALKNVIRYHLRGPVDQLRINRVSNEKLFFDVSFQLEAIIPYDKQDFGYENTEFKNDFTADEIDFLLSFISNGLLDRNSTKVGDLGNPVGHPKSVPSKLSPSVTRDNGKQTDFLGR